MAWLLIRRERGCAVDEKSPGTVTLTEAIDELAKEHVEVGAMIGVVRPGETLVLSYGTKHFGTVDPPDRHTLLSELVAAIARY